MSYIDMFDHEHVGFFAGLPIYRPLESYTPEETLSGEFSCSPDNLILGGGYLEHPGMVVRNLDVVAAYFISDWIDYCEDTKSSIYPDEETDKWSEYVHGKLFGQDRFEVIDCVHWSMRDYSEFYATCQSNAMNSPFKETQQRNAFEPWLAQNIGELVVFSFPELISDKSLGEIAKKVDRYLYGNTMILPAGYPTDHLGRQTENGEIKQGNRAWKVTRND